MAGLLLVLGLWFGEVQECSPTIFSIELNRIRVETIFGECYVPVVSDLDVEIHTPDYYIQYMK